MKRPANLPALDSSSPHSAVYIAARTEWNERYGSYIAQAHAWRLTALAALAVALVAVFGIVWIGTENRVVPFVVETNRLGDALAVSRADVAAPVDSRLIRAQLARWIRDVRSVYVDVGAERKLITEAYTMVDRSGAADRALNEWFSQNDPFKRGASDTVGIDVESVLPLSAATWRIEWREDRRSRGGALEAQQHWEATVTVSVNPPTDDATILVNPTGLYVEAFDWTARQ
jgi:type IV secretion system protein TrbF